MASTRFRISTMMVLIFDLAILLAVWHLMESRSGHDIFLFFFLRLIVEFLIAIILLVFTLMVVLGFGRKGRGYPKHRRDNGN
jgi:hypothetical protein